MFDPVTAANPPAGSEAWPVAELTETARLTLLPPPAAGDRPTAPAYADIAALSCQIAERLASFPPDQRAAVLALLTAQVNRPAAAG